MTRAPTLAALSEQHPEWQPWLALFGIARAAVDDAVWKDAVPATPAPAADGAPRVAGATLAIDSGRAARLLGELLDHASAPRVPESAAPAVFEAAIAEDGERLRALAVEAGANAERFATVAALAVMPLLQQCREAWHASIAADFMAAACPICGAWATLAEARGLERRLRLRCGRCGSEWSAQVLRCAFCGTIDHGQLGALVGETPGDTRRVDTCAVCRGYMKTITTLVPIPPADVLLHDLATVELDVAALSQGYARSATPAKPLGVRVVARPRRAGLGRWRR